MEWTEGREGVAFGRGKSCGGLTYGMIGLFASLHCSILGIFRIQFKLTLLLLSGFLNLSILVHLAGVASSVSTLVLEILEFFVGS